MEEGQLHGNNSSSVWGQGYGEDKACVLSEHSGQSDGPEEMTGLELKIHVVSVTAR